MRRRSTQAPRRYERHGILALEPKAFLDFFLVPESRGNEMLGGGVCVVDISGPLDQYDEGFFDSYESIRTRVKAAAADHECRAIVMRIDSPGGDCPGCFDTARTVRRICLDAKKPLLAYVEKANSAAYALACAAQTIVLSDTAIVGSIGVISTREDVTASDAQRGLRVALIASGKRKADGHPHTPITDDELAETQIIVNSLARKFFELVSDMRGLSVEGVAALEARIFHGEAAIAAQLADSIDSFDAFVERLGRGDFEGTEAMASDYEKARDCLRKAAEGDDANAEAARRALAAMGEGEDEEAKPEEGGGDSAAADGGADDDDDETKPKPGAEGADDKPDAEGDDKKPDAEGDEKKPQSKDALSIALKALEEVHKLKAKDSQRTMAAERQQLLDSRPDFAPELRACLEQSDMKTVRRMVKELPRVPTSKASSTTTTTTQGTRGKTQQSRTTGTTGAATGVKSEAQARNEELDRRMGITKTKLGAKREGNRVTFGVVAEDDSATSATKH